MIECNMSETIQLRQKNPDEEENMAKLEEPDNDVYGYLSRAAADQLGEYLEIAIGGSASVEAHLDKTTSNFGVYETPGGAVVGLGIRKSILSEFSDDDEVPESISIEFSASSKEDWEDAEGVDEEEVAALVSDSTESDADEEETVEVSDEELDLVDAE